MCGGMSMTAYEAFEVSCEVAWSILSGKETRRKHGDVVKECALRSKDAGVVALIAFHVAP